MITGIQDFYYNVENMKRAVKFYCDILGMEIIDEGDYWTSLKIGEIKLGLHWTEGEKIPPISFDSHGPHSGGTLTLKSDNINEELKILNDENVDVLGFFDEPWGKIIVFKDSEGNILKIMQNVI